MKKTCYFIGCMVLCCMFLLVGCDDKQETSLSVPEGDYVCDADSSFSISVGKDAVTLTNANYDGTLQLYLVAEYSLQSKKLKEEGVEITEDKEKELKEEITAKFDASLYAGKTYTMSLEEGEMEGKKVTWVYLLDGNKTEVSGLSGSYWAEDGTLWIAGAAYHKK